MNGLWFFLSGNSAPSQMAERLLRKHADARFGAQCAGAMPSVGLIREIGVEISHHSSSANGRN
jgi:protein-tyrosine-phosphatase